MIVTDIKSTFNKMKVAQAYADLNKVKYPFGYTLFIDDKPQGYWVEKPNIVPNEEYVASIQKDFSTNPEFAYHTKNLTIYYSPISVNNHDDYQVTNYLESINSFDGHKVNVHNIAFKINDRLYFTNRPVSNLPILLGAIRLYNESVFYKIKYFGMNFYDCNYVVDVPKKFDALLPLPSEVRFDKFIAIDFINKYLPLIDMWNKTSFLKAREFSVVINNIILAS